MTLIFDGLIETVIIYGFIEQSKEYLDSIPFIKTPWITGLPLIAINLLKFHKEASCHN